MKSFSKLVLSGLIFMSLFFIGCDKTDPYDLITPESQVHFTGPVNQNYSILVATPPVYNVEIGTTDVSSVDRLVTYKVTSPTGATGGNQYSIASGNNSGTVTIPAGTALTNLAVQGNFAAYDATGRKDTLVITLEAPTVTAAKFFDTVKLALRGPCFEGDVDRTALTGAFNNTIETFGTGAPYGPYSTAVTAFTTTSATTGVITVTNIWDNGWGPLQFNVDWTDPANRVVTAVSQPAIPGSNAGDLNPAYAGQTVAVRAFLAPSAANTGSFSACNQTFTLRMQLGVTGLGYFANIYTVNLGR